MDMRQAVKALITAERRHQTYLRLAERNRTERDALIQEFAAAGMSHATISKAVGLSRARVGQIALERTPDAP